MAVINNEKNFSTIQIKKDIHFVFGSLEFEGKNIEKIKNSLTAFNKFFETLGEERPIVNMDWRTGQKDEWVLSDDFRIVQILNRIENKGIRTYNKAVIRTCVGTFAVNEKTFFDTDFELHPDRYRISTKNKQNYERVITRKEATANEKNFAKRVAVGTDPTQAYMQTFNTNNKDYAKEMSRTLLKQERVHSTISREVEQILEDEGVSKRYIIQQYKELIDQGLLNIKDCSGSVRAALKDLADMSAMMPSKNTQSASTRGVFEIDDDELAQIESREEQAFKLAPPEQELEMSEEEIIEMEEFDNEEDDSTGILSEVGRDLLR